MNILDKFLHRCATQRSSMISTWLVLGLTLTVSATAHSQLLSASGGDARDLYAVSSSNWLAATQGAGVVRTTDSGATWVASAPSTDAALQLARSMKNANKLAGSGATVYAATEGGLFKSTDAGVSWARLTADVSATVAVNPSNVNEVLVGVKGAGIIRSVDGGGTFTDFSAGLEGADVRAIVYASSTIVYAGIHSAGPDALNGGVYRSISGGAWADFNTSTLPANHQRQVTALEVDSGGNLLVGTTIGLLRANGSGWTPLAAAPADGLGQVTTIHRDRNNGNKIWVGQIYAGPIVSLNNGATFTRFATNVNDQVERDLFTRVNAFLTGPGISGVIRAVEGLGLWRTNGNSPDTDISTSLTGFKFDRVRSFAIAPSTPSTMYMGLYSGGIHKSVDGGNTWQRIVAGFENKLGNNEYRRLSTAEHLAVNPQNANDVYAAMYEYGLFRTVNGQNWTVINPGSVFNNFQLGTTQKPTGLIYTTPTGSEILYSVFSPSAGIFRGSGNSYALSVNATSGAGKLVRGPSGRIYHLTVDGKPMISSNAGVSFQPTAVTDEALLGFVRVYATALAESAANANIVVIGTNKGIFRSTNGGGLFTKVAGAGLPISSLSSMLYSGATLIAADPQGTVWRSCNNGDSFEFVTNSPSSFVGLTVSGSSLFISIDGRGVFKTALPTC